MKRADTGFMLLVAYTSIADDEKAKLLLFPLISGGVFSTDLISTARAGHLVL